MIPTYAQAAPIPYIPAHMRIKESSFSKPGTPSKSSKGWKPAKGVKFRPMSAKGPGRPRKKLRDPRDVQYY